MALYADGKGVVTPSETEALLYSKLSILTGVGNTVLSANSNLTSEFKDYFTNVTGTTYSNHGSTTYEFYALFVGGNAYYHIFAVVDDCMVVNTAV